MAANQENIVNKVAPPVMNFLAATSKYLPPPAPAAPRSKPALAPAKKGPKCYLCGSTVQLIYSADMGIMCLAHSNRAQALIEAYHCVNTMGLSAESVKKELRLRQEFREEYKIPENERHRTWENKLRSMFDEKALGVDAAPAPTTQSL